jgi:hypothetical protein
MNYAKPEMAVLGEAARVIEFVGLKESFGLFDSFFYLLRINPAYDLDE